MRGGNHGNDGRALALLAAAAIVLGPAAVRAAEEANRPASIWEQDTLTGDWGTARTALKDRGIDVAINYIGETLAVLSGGIDRRASYEGRLEVSVDSDLEKLIGWKGATTHVTVFQIHNGGRNAADHVGSLFDPSNIDAVPTTRLFTAWFEQSLTHDVSLRLGQLAGDDEFIVSPTAGGLINGTFGWAAILAANMTSGGPAYPLATPGARLKLNATDNLTLLAAVFSGDPAGPDCHDVPQQCNKHGTTFSFTGGTLWMGEAQYAVNQGKDAQGLAGVYKLGFWYATAGFADQHFGLTGSGAVVSLADPAAVAALDHRGNWGLYGVADQTVWRGEAASLNLFLRGGASPSDRNLLSFYVDGGAGLRGLLPGRANDVLTLGVAYGRISPDAAALDRDIALAAPPYPIRDYELLFELSYQAQIAPWWIVQPDIQYILHPGGHVPDPNNPTAAVRDAFIAGIRSTVKF
jgi:porin